MAGKKRVARIDSTKSVQFQQSQDSQNLQLSQISAKSRCRTKNYTEQECEILLRCCNNFHNIINRNSNRDADQQNKKKAWVQIQKQFKELCGANGIIVS